MEPVNLMTEATNLTFFGMGFVFLFLTLMVFVTKLMSIIIQKIQNSASIKADASPDAGGAKTRMFRRNKVGNELDEETRSVIKSAIKMHRGA